MPRQSETRQQQKRSFAFHQHEMSQQQRLRTSHDDIHINRDLMEIEHPSTQQFHSSLVQQKALLHFQNQH